MTGPRFTSKYYIQFIRALDPRGAVDAMSKRKNSSLSAKRNIKQACRTSLLSY